MKYKQKHHFRIFLKRLFKYKTKKVKKKIFIKRLKFLKQCLLFLIYTQMNISYIKIRKYILFFFFFFFLNKQNSIFFLSLEKAKEKKINKQKKIIKSKKYFFFRYYLSKKNKKTKLV